MVQLTQPSLPPLKEYLRYLSRIWRNKYLTNNGLFHEALERKLRKLLCVKRLTLVANGTLALQLVIKVLDLKGEVITTPFTFAATTNALVWEGLSPVFADIDPETFNLDPRAAEKKITRKTSAILAVHVFGNPCYPEEFEYIARKHRLKLIFDAAHAFGVKYKNRSILNYGDASTLSFHATKVFNTVEGGAVVTKNVDIYRKVRLLRNFGIDKSREDIILPGINAKMNELEAVMGLCNLQTVDKGIDSRMRMYALYKKLLDGNNIGFQKLIASRYNYSYMPICFGSKAERDRVTRNLLKKGIKVRKYFHPLTSNSRFFKKAFKLPIASRVAERILCLPLHEGLKAKNVKRIVEIILS